MQQPAVVIRACKAEYGAYSEQALEVAEYLTTMHEFSETRDNGFIVRQAEVYVPGVDFLQACNECGVPIPIDHVWLKISWHGAATTICCYECLEAEYAAVTRRPKKRPAFLDEFSDRGER